jgi:hypothetical protein
MLRPMVRGFLCAAVVAVVAAGCGDDSATNPSNTDLDGANDVAVQAAAGAAAATGGFEFEMAVAGAGFRFTTTAPDSKSTPLQTASDTTLTLGGLTFTQSRTFYNLQGDPLPGYGLTAVRLVIDSRVTGSIVTTRYAATVGRTGTLDVRGIQALADTLHFEGTAQDTAQCAFRSLSGARQRYFYTVDTRSIENVAVLKDRTANPWPLSGRIVWTVTADRLRSNNRNDIEWHFTGTAILTFDGTSTPELVVNGTFHYRVNLLSGEITVP